MSKRALAILIGAVLAVGGGTAALATTLGGDDDDSAQPVHTLEGGTVHTGEMPEGEHQMEDGETMDGEQ